MTDEELWQRYSTTRDPALREEIILRFAPLTHYVLARLGYTPPSKADYDDLISQGLLGLIDAVDHYDPSRGVRFSTYATIRIRSRILDSLRAMDWLSRSVRRRTRQIQSAIFNLQSTLGRPPEEEEIAAHVGISLAELREALMQANQVILSLETENHEGEPGLSLRDILPDDDAVDPLEEVSEAELLERLKRALAELPERERLLISLYYHNELTMKEIGTLLNISESRVCQMHAKAILSLRAGLLSYEKAEVV
ncbi:MAG: RNA polymerase sigma factor WhiG [Chloroflexota bacterium]